MSEFYITYMHGCSNRYWAVGSGFYESDKICKEDIKSLEKVLQEKLSTDSVVILNWKKLDDEECKLESTAIIDTEKQVAHFRGLAEKLTNEDKLKELEIKQLSRNILGRRIRCDCMSGTVVLVDGDCQIHVKLDNGGLLVLNPDDDGYTVL